MNLPAMLRLSCLLLCLVILYPAISMAAETAPANPAEGLTVNLRDSDIHALIDTVAKATGKTFVVDPRVQGKVTVISAGGLDGHGLYQLFQSILKVQGYSAVPAGKIIKIIPDSSAKEQAGSVLTGPAAGGDGVATLVYRLENVLATDLVPVLRPLLPQAAHLAAHPDSNTIIAADSIANLDRLLKILHRVDTSGANTVEVIRLQHANASELARVLIPAFGSGANGKRVPGQALTVVADERSNSLLVSGNRKRRLELRTLVAHLDTPIHEESDTEVIYLRYAVAADLVPILSALGQKLGLSEEEKSRNKKGADKGIQAPLFDIQADDNLNALIVHAPPKRLRAVKSVIEQLDVRRSQVLVEGIIAEVSSTVSRELGVQWQTNLPKKGYYGAANLPGAAAGGLLQFPGSPFSLAEGLTLGYLRGGNINILLRAISKDGNSNVLSTPTLMTLDNEEAEIVVGKNVPFVTGQFTNNTTTPDNPFQTVKRQDVGVLLKVKPQINAGGSVRLDISQEISSIDTSTTAKASDLITNKRSLKTSVLVDDGDIVVLGGLLSDQQKRSVSKVPLLGDIPVLGQLFRNTATTSDKTNLMIFLRPRIAASRNDGQRLTHEKYHYLRDLQGGQTGQRGMDWPGYRPPGLPDYQSLKSGKTILKPDYGPEQGRDGSH